MAWWSGGVGERYPDRCARARACAVCPRNFEGSSAKASLELKYDGGLGTARGRLRLVHVGQRDRFDLESSMSIAKPGGKTRLGRRDLAPHAARTGRLAGHVDPADDERRGRRRNSRDVGRRAGRSGHPGAVADWRKDVGASRVGASRGTIGRSRASHPTNGVCDEGRSAPHTRGGRPPSPPPRPVRVQFEGTAAEQAACCALTEKAQSSARAAVPLALQSRSCTPQLLRAPTMAPGAILPRANSTCSPPRARLRSTALPDRAAAPPRARSPSTSSFARTTTSWRAASRATTWRTRSSSRT